MANMMDMALKYWTEKLEENNSKVPGRPIHTKKDFLLTKENEYSKICETLQNNAHFPTTPCYNLLRRKCQIELEERKFKQAAMTLLQSQAITFHHKALQQYGRRISKLSVMPSGNKEALNPSSKDKTCDDEVDIFEDASSDEEEDTPIWSKNGESLDEMLRRILSFQSPKETTQKFASCIKKLPKEWRIVQISSEHSLKSTIPFTSAAKDEGM